LKKQEQNHNWTTGQGQEHNFPFKKIVVHMIVTAVQSNNRTNNNKETMIMNPTDKDGVRADNNILDYLFQCKYK